MASPSLIEGKILSASQIGILGSMFSVVYAIGRLVNGILSDRTPPWIMLSIGLAFAGIGNLAISFLPPFIAILLLWSINAYAQSMLWSSVLCVVSSIYDSETAKKRTPYMVSAVAVGNILGILLGSFIIEKFGVRFAFVIPGMITLVFALLTVISTHGIPAPKLPQNRNIFFFKQVKEPLVLRMVFPAMFHGVMKDNISLWMTVFFVTAYNIDLSHSAGYVLFIPIIGLVGRLSYPLFFKLFGENEHRVSRLGFLICIFAAFVLCIKAVPPLMAAICLALIYVAVSLINTTFLSVFPLNFTKSGNVASISGIMDFCTYLGAGIGSFAYGFAIEQSGFIPVFVSWIAISFISFIILLCPNAFEIK